MDSTTADLPLLDSNQCNTFCSVPAEFPNKFLNFPAFDLQFGGSRQNAHLTVLLAAITEIKQ